MGIESGFKNSRALPQFRLFCFPYAGGSETAYARWQEHVGDAIEVVAVQLPGRGARLKERPFRRLTPLVLALSESLSPAMDRPFALFGHSMGGLIAFELARQLRRECRHLPVHLFISAKRCPQRAESMPASEISDTELIEALRSYGGTPAEVLHDPELMDLLLPTIRADIEICRTYVCDPEPPLDCPITVFGGLNDHVSSRAWLEGWREQTSASFTLRMFPGGHLFIQKWETSMLHVICKELALPFEKKRTLKEK